MRQADVSDARSRTGPTIQQVQIGAASIDVLAAALSPARAAELRIVAERAHRLLAGRIVWNVNATAHGGGVAEMLQSLLAYGRGAGVDTRWLVIQADAEFFTITKRLHNALHGSPGDGGALTEREHAHYRAVLAENLALLRPLVRSQDIVVLHDPQTAGLVQGLRATGANVIWRCHIGCDTQNEHTHHGWTFLQRYAQQADAFIFSRKTYAPDWAQDDRLSIITPSIDPFSSKNQDIDSDVVGNILRRVGLIAGEDSAPIPPFRRRDGTDGLIRSHRNLICDGPPPDAATRLVVQISRWDRLKDMAGVLSGFATDPAPPEAHLMLAGPDVSGVTDDPEGTQILRECRSRWLDLPDAIRARIHLACLPMDDIDENALIVNALQRHSYLIVQKSLAEGFGLTVTEAMWKGRPVVASAVGGIRDQITDGRDGVLLSDPHDLTAFAVAINTLLRDPEHASALGAAGHLRVSDKFLGDRHLALYVDLFARLCT